MAARAVGSVARAFVDEPEEWAELLAGTAEEHASQPERICALCVAILDVDGAGISMRTNDSGWMLICATNDTARRIEELQGTLGEGPAVDAVNLDTPILVADLEEQGEVALDRWPGFVNEALAAGVRAVFAFPLRLGAISLGVLELHRTEPRPLRRSQVSGALVAADAAAVALLHAGNVRHDDDGGERPLGFVYEPSVHQATGMVQVQLAVTIEEAFVILRARAFADGRPLAEVAEDVVSRKLRFTAADR